MESIQVEFFNELRNKIGPNESLANHLSDLLDISMDSAYRRLRGETPTTIDELFVLCQKYNMSFDSFCNVSNGNVSFQYKSLIAAAEDVLGCFEKIYDDISLVLQCKTKKIMTAASDIQPFHLYKYPELTAFKLHNWIYSMLPVEKGGKVSPEHFNYRTMLDAPEIKDYLQKIVRLYEQVPAVEIWTDDTIMGFLKSIRFYHESYLYNNKEELLSLCNNILDILESLFVKQERDNLELYISDIDIENNYIFIQADEVKLVYLKLYSLNNIMTTNPDFCTETETWINNLISKSTLVSGSSEAVRKKFYMRNKKKVETLMREIEES